MDTDIKELYQSQFSECKQYHNHFNNEDIYELIKAINEVLYNMRSYRIIHLPNYVLALAYRDALVKLLDEKYDNTN